MTHQITLGNAVVDSFSVFNTDGYTKRSGETLFTTTVYKDGVVSAVTATIAEIGTSGEYRITFTPTSVGLWKAQVLANYDKNWWEVDADVSLPVSEAMLNISYDDSIPRLFMEVWLERNGSIIPQANLTSCQVKVYDVSGTLLTTKTSSSPKVDGHFSLTYDTSLTGNRPYNFEVTVTDNKGSVTTGQAMTAVE